MSNSTYNDITTKEFAYELIRLTMHWVFGVKLLKSDIVKSFVDAVVAKLIVENIVSQDPKRGDKWRGRTVRCAYAYAIIKSCDWSNSTNGIIDDLISEFKERNSNIYAGLNSRFLRIREIQNFMIANDLNSSASDLMLLVKLKHEDLTVCALNNPCVHLFVIEYVKRLHPEKERSVAIQNALRVAESQWSQVTQA